MICKLPKYYDQDCRFIWNPINYSKIANHLSRTWFIFFFFFLRLLGVSLTFPKIWKVSNVKCHSCQMSFLQVHVKCHSCKFLATQLAFTCWKLTIETLEQGANFEPISHLVLVFLVFLVGQLLADHSVDAPSFCQCWFECWLLVS